MENMITVTTVSKSLGISNRMLRYYEQAGLVQSCRADDYAYRMYDADAVARLRHIVVLRKLRVPVKQIRAIFENRDASLAVAVFRHNISALSEEITALSTIRSILDSLVEKLRDTANIHVPLKLLDDKDLYTILDSVNLPDTTMDKITPNTGGRIEQYPFTMTESCPSQETRLEEKNMADLKKADEILNRNIEVKYVVLPAARTVAIDIVSADADTDALSAIRTWLKDRSLQGTARIFMYDVAHEWTEHNPDWGKGCLATIPEGIPIEPPYYEKRLPGGTFVMSPGREDINDLSGRYVVEELARDINWEWSYDPRDPNIRYLEEITDRVDGPPAITAYLPVKKNDTIEGHAVSLSEYKWQYSTIRISAEVRRTGAQGFMFWQQNNAPDYTVGKHIPHAPDDPDYPQTPDYIPYLDPDKWHRLEDEWTSYLYSVMPNCFVNTGGPDAANAVYEVRNLTIDVIEEYMTEHIKSYIVPAIVEGFTVAAPWRNGLTDVQLRAGIDAFREFLYALHDKIGAKFTSYDEKRKELFTRYLPGLLACIGIYGQLKGNVLHLDTTDLLTHSKNSKYMTLKKCTHVNRTALFAFLAEMGFSFEGLNYSKKVDMSTPFCVSHTNADIIVGLKLLAQATQNIDADKFDLDWGFMRCSHYPLASDTPVMQTLHLTDFLVALPPEHREWTLDLQDLLLAKGCEQSVETWGNAIFQYLSPHGNRDWVCQFEFQPYRYSIRMNTNNVHDLNAILPSLPPVMELVLGNSGCSSYCCANGPHRVMYNGQEYKACKAYGWKFIPTDANDYEALKKWIIAELGE